MQYIQIGLVVWTICRILQALIGDHDLNSSFKSDSTQLLLKFETYEDLLITRKTHGYSVSDICTTILDLIVVMAIFRFTVFYLVNRYLNKEKFSWDLSYNTLSMIICSISSIFSLYTVAKMPLIFAVDLLRFDFTKTRMSLERFDYDSSDVAYVCLIMIAYFTYDVIFNEVSVEYKFHHVLAVFGTLIYITSHTYTFYVCAAMVTELSTIFLSSSIFFGKESTIKKYLTVIFAGTFFLTRIVFISIVFGIAWFVEFGARFYVITTCFGLISSLNIYWFMLIVKKVFSRLNNQVDKNEKKETD